MAKEGQEKIVGTVPAEVAEKVRNLVYWTPEATISAVLTAALEMFLREYEAKRGPIQPRPVSDLRSKGLPASLFGDIIKGEAPVPQEDREEEEEEEAPRVEATKAAPAGKAARGARK
jgi:hypothetical protein